MLDFVSGPWSDDDDEMRLISGSTVAAENVLSLWAVGTNEHVVLTALTGVVPWVFRLGDAEPPKLIEFGTMLVLL